MYKNLLRILETIVFTVVLVLAVAALPSLLSYGRPSIVQYASDSDRPDSIAKRLYRIHFQPDNLWRKPVSYFRLLKSGDVFKYTEGKNVRYYLEEFPRYFKTSFFYVSIAGIISLAAGLIISLNTADRRNNPPLYEFLSFMTVFPDFILILVIQFLFFYLNRAAGGTIIRLYSPSASDRAVLLPVLIMSIYPTLYIVRTIGGQLKDLNSEIFIRFAHSKGLSDIFIRYFHLGPAAVRFISGDLHKILAILFSNMFITELMFNNKGMTFFLFNNISEYAVTVNTIVLMLILYASVYACLRLCLALIGRFLRRSGL